MVRNAPRGGWTRLGELFADPSHFRGDCRLLRTAIRRGWVDGLTDDERGDIVARFNIARDARDADPMVSDNARFRGLLASIGWMLAIDRRDIDDARRELHRTWPHPKPLNGRPRDRYHVSDHKQRIDATALRRQYVKAGGDPSDVTALDVIAGEYRVRVNVTQANAAPGFAPRWMLSCPRCGRPRLHLFATVGGLGCRGCLRIGYGK
jgi:hypothetical protein